jgi:hypothetical protein
VINFSPAGFYHFTPLSLSPKPPLLQVVYDDWIDQFLLQRLVSFHHDYKVLFPVCWKALCGVHLAHQDGFVKRRYFRDGFYQAVLASNDGQPIDQAGYQLDYYSQIVDWLTRHPEKCAQERQKWLSLIEQATEKGWKVVIIHLPVGIRMASLENRLPASLSGKAVAAAAGVPYLDYQNDSRAGAITTLDESHLHRGSARKVSWLVGSDIGSLLRDQE